MLTELSIENFAIIDRLHVEFGPGFTVLTGETGAGKSIIIDALQAALGGRVSGDIVQNGARAASVEAIFDRGAEEEPLAGLLREIGVEDDEVLILRRDITAAGRGTARINGRAVPVTTLSGIGALLVDIHGQSDHLSVLRRDRQLDMLDRYGELQSLRAETTAAIREYVAARRRLEELSQGQRDMAQRLDLLRFQVQEIESAQLQPGEEEELAGERTLLTHAEKRTQLSSRAYEELAGEAGAAAERLAAATVMVRDLSGIDPSLTPLSARLESAQLEIEDAAQEIRAYRDAVEYDPARLDVIEDRLDLITRLKRKYGATLEDVIAFGAHVRSELDDVENFDERLNELSAAVEHSEARAGLLAGRLSQQRSETATRLTVAMRTALQGLGLKGTAFEVRLDREVAEDGLPVPGEGRVAYSQSGVDSITFLASFNPGEPLRPIERVASGGETSRFLLALKSVLAEADRIQTLIFDEVDVGVGARNGAVVGERLRQLAGEHQVISITHLPQVAALADEHLTVAKDTLNGSTSVGVRSLAPADRVGEIAAMMSGSDSEAARRNAQELMEAARRS